MSRELPPGHVITKSGKSTRLTVYHTSWNCPYVGRMDAPKVRNVESFPIDDRYECGHPECADTWDYELNDNDPLEFQRKHGLL